MRADTHSLASSIVLSVFFIVSFVFVSIIVIMSLRTRTTSVVDGRHIVGDAWASRAAEVASVSAERIRARCASGEPADGQPVASDLSSRSNLT